MSKLISLQPLQSSEKTVPVLKTELNPKVSELNVPKFSPIRVVDPKIAERTLTLRKRIPDAPDIRSLKPSKSPSATLQASYNSLVKQLYQKEETPISETKNLSNEVEEISEPESESKSVQIIQKALEPIKKVQPKKTMQFELQGLLEDPVLEVKQTELDELIEVVPISKKECVIWFERKQIPYFTFREDTDHIIFYRNEHFYGYSKLKLYEEFLKIHQQLYFGLKIWERVDGDFEPCTLWIPMSQISKMLEYSHPMYEIESMRFTINVFTLKPIQLKKQ